MDDFNKIDKQIDRNVNSKFYKRKGKPTGVCEDCGKDVYNHYRRCYDCFTAA